MTEREQVQVTQADRDAVDAFHAAQLKRIFTGDKTLGENRDAIEQAFARHRIEATAEALEAMREAREALEYCKVEAYCSVDAECGSVDRYGYGRIETNAREVLTRLTAAIAKIEGDTK